MNSTSCVASYLGSQPTEANAKVWAVALELAEIAIKMGVSIDKSDYGMIGNACHRKASDLEDQGIKLRTSELEKQALLKTTRLLHQLACAFAALTRATNPALKLVLNQAKEMDQFWLEAEQAKRLWELYGHK